MPIQKPCAIWLCILKIDLSVQSWASQFQVLSTFQLSICSTSLVWGILNQVQFLIEVLLILVHLYHGKRPPLTKTIQTLYDVMFYALEPHYLATWYLAYKKVFISLRWRFEKMLPFKLHTQLWKEARLYILRTSMWYFVLPVGWNLPTGVKYYGLGQMTPTSLYC